MAKRAGRKDGTKARQWAEVMEAWSESGQTQEAFCRQQRIPLSAFRYWRYRRRAGQRAGGPGKAAPGRKAVETREESSVQTFVPVRIVPASTPEAARIAVVLTNGRRLEVPPDMDIDWLARAATALESSPC